MHSLDRPLLVGLIALEKQFVSADELIDAFRQWREQPGGSLGEILASRAKLPHDRFASLQALVDASSLVVAADGTSEEGGPTTTWRPDSTSIDHRIVVTDSPDTEQPDESKVTSQTTLAARFKPIHLHARGGLGHVFLAEDLELHRQVALKEIRFDAADDSASRQRFVAEAKITGNLEHPGIVPVYGLGVHADGRPFYAMRFIQGQTLADAIKKFHADHREDFTSLEFRQLVGRLVAVCNAVGFAHSRNIVHRDLKPPNVMLGPFGETLVVDWGLAKPFRPSSDETTLHWQSDWPSTPVPSQRENVTQMGEIVGTPAYMSPEQARGAGDAIGPLSDVYGLGSTLYALLTGHSPRAGSSTDIVEAVKKGDIVPPRQLAPRAPRALIAICEKAMALKPRDRYLSALDLAADLERWLADEPVQAYVEPWTDRAFRFMRKHRLPVAVASALLVVISAALAIGYSLVRGERDIARQERASAVTARDAAEHERASALAANARARDNAAATRQIIEQYLIRIGDDRFSIIPGFEGVRLDLAKIAVDRYREMLSQQPDDASLVADAGMAMRRSANLYRMVGQDDAAENLYSESILHLRKAAQYPPEAPKAEQWLCETLCDQALLTSRIRGPKAAIDSMRQALAASRQLQARNATSTAARQVSARIEADLADLLREIGQYAEAVSLARSAAATQTAAADQNSRPLANRLSASLSGVNLGEVLREADQLAEAEAVLKKALDRTSGYLQQTASEPNLRFIRARALHELALVHASRSDVASAATELAQATEFLNRLADDFPMVISYRRKLGQVLTDTARLDLERGEVQLATDAAQRSIELLEEIDAKQKSGAVQRSLTNAFLAAAEIAAKRSDPAAAQGYVARARAALDRAREYNPDSPELAVDARRLEALLQP